MFVHLGLVIGMLAIVLEIVESTLYSILAAVKKERRENTDTLLTAATSI